MHNLPIAKPKTLGSVWKTIPGYSFFQISDFGEVRRDPAKRMWGWGPSRLPGSLLKPCYHDYTDKYLVVRLHADDGKNKVARVHQIVCMTFRGPRPSSEHCALHKNDDRHDNRESNLYWGTKKQNAIDRERNGKSGTALLDLEKVLWIKELYFGDKWRIEEIAELFAVSPQVIRGVTAGHRYQWAKINWGDLYALQEKR